MSFLIAECFQNIIRHAEKPEIKKDHKAQPKMLLLRSLKDSFFITTSNLIENDTKEKLKNRLQSLENLSQDELKKLYRDVLAKEGYTEKGGGGLGLIEMARKSKNPLAFDFDFINDKQSNFYLQLKLNDKKDKRIDHPTHLSLDEAKSLYHEMNENKVVMVRKGEFSQSSILPIFELLENSFNIDKEHTEYKKRALYLLIELLQNISKHQPDLKEAKEGIFLIQKKNKKNIICTGNFILNEEVNKMKNQIDEIVEADDATLKKMYKAKLLSDLDSQKSAGTGLIEIGRYSSDELMYDVQPVNEKMSFFTLRAAI